jgi:hypothetical protein
MAREFKPVRFFVMMAIAAFIVCGVTAFYTERAKQGRTSDERSAYVIGKRAGEESAAAGKPLPTAAGLNMMAQERFKQEGSGNQSDWDLGFERGYEDGFKARH